MTQMRIAKLATLLVAGALLAGCIVLPSGHGPGRRGHHGHYLLEPSSVKIDIGGSVPALGERRP